MLTSFYPPVFRKPLSRSLVFSLITACQSAAYADPATPLPVANRIDSTHTENPTTDLNTGLNQPSAGTALEYATLLQEVSTVSSRIGPPTAFAGSPTLSPLAIRHDDAWQRMRENFQLTRLRHPAIDKQIDFLRSGLRSLNSNLSSAEPYLFFIIEEIEKAGLPMDIALLPLIESAFDPGARSSQSALGLWQFMPATAQTVDLKINKWYDGRLDPIESTHAAIRYLKRLHSLFDGDWLLALAAYNAGPGNVQSAIRKAGKRGRPTDFWHLKLPAETVNYVPRLIAAARLIEHPDRYGLTLPAIDNRPRLKTLSIGRRISIPQAAVFAKIPADKLRRHNLAFIADRTPPSGPHRLNIPVEQVKPLITALNKTKRHALVGTLINTNSSNPKTTGYPDNSHPGTHKEPQPYRKFKSYKTYHYKSHTVQQGDNLWDLSRSMGVDVNRLITWNGISSEEEKLKLGRKLKVAYLTDDSETATKTLNYLVTSEDTLFTIAEKFQLRMHEVKKWNPDLWHKNRVSAGQLLRIPIP
ncbi:hypothetical protein AB833_19685 [Chromatiales bacterium (ex Bugula neritina AB1)]|nr:hypothetical protein AB833_19685 [Chromatiales bacterium (ex Bugula neritina AB1)]